MVKVQTKKGLKIKKEFCKECGLCVHFCPDGALQSGDGFNSRGYHPVEWNGECSFCGRCYIVCPDYAIEIKEDEALEG
jgi:2-oxoglutarate ferredoxin oxidoreductase subunit delta